MHFLFLAGPLHVSLPAPMPLPALLLPACSSACSTPPSCSPASSFACSILPPACSIRPPACLPTSPCLPSDCSTPPCLLLCLLYYTLPTLLPALLLPACSPVFSLPSLLTPVCSPVGSSSCFTTHCTDETE